MCNLTSVLQKPQHGQREMEKATVNLSLFTLQTPLCCEHWSKFKAGLYKGTIGCMLCSFGGIFSEMFTVLRRHSQDVFPLGISPRERNKALHLPETQSCQTERGREMSSCHVNIVHSLLDNL